MALEDECKTLEELLERLRKIIQFNYFGIQ